MAALHRVLRVNTAELRRTAGIRRAVDAEVTALALGLDDPRIDGPVTVALIAESTIDGIVVSGTVGVHWGDECRRCLRELALGVDIAIDELYQERTRGVVPDAESGFTAEAFEIEADALDLQPAVRDAVLLALADPPPLCRVDCAGLCPVCGIDRNAETCSCDLSVRDERWAVLDELELDE